MLSVKVYDKEAKIVGEMELCADVFGREYNESI